MPDDKQYPAGESSPTTAFGGCGCRSTGSRSSASESIETGPTNAALADWLTEAGQGDLNAFARVYDSTSTRIYSLVAQQVGPRAAAALTEGVYVALWRQCATFDAGSDHALAWIVSRAHHLLTERRRTERANGGGVGPLLTRSEQDILTLVHLGRYSHREVAVLLGVPHPTVTATARTGLRRLTAELPAA